MALWRETVSANETGGKNFTETVNVNFGNRRTSLSRKPAMCPAKQAKDIFRRASTFASAAVLATTQAAAAPPDQHSKQRERMAPYKTFITSLHRPDGQYCCDYRDGRMGDGGKELQEERINLPDGRVKYRVFVERHVFDVDSHDPDKPESAINRDYDAIIPPEGKWFEIDPDHALIATQKDVQQCLAQNKDCAAPPNNVLWLGITKNSHGVSEPVDYCYWPIQRWTENRHQPSRFATVDYRLVDRSERPSTAP
jgi:hypothetical protein